MRYWIKKYYKLFTTAFAFVINSIGLVLSFIGAFSGEKFSQSETFITMLLFAAECFLVFAAIYSVISIINNAHNKLSIEQKEAELMCHHNANKRIFENHKASVTYYKDFRDKLNVLVSHHQQKIADVQNLSAIISEIGLESCASKTTIESFIHSAQETNIETLKGELIELYNRFIINIIDVLQETIEEYLRTKGCSTNVSIALKQLDQPTKYSKIDDKNANIYTAFRDKKTYLSKTRNETWQKSFCIRKNSDFIFSIEKDYYIFNYVTKNYSENGLYLNENTNFYENYNSGVTCTIYSCVDRERVLYGFLACDSLFDEQTEKKCGKNIFDYNVANLLMSTAHIIALFLGDFLEKWDQYYVQNGCDMTNSEAYEVAKKERNLCKVMIDRVNNNRYRG